MSNKYSLTMRCPRCGSANFEDFFQNTQRQTRSFGVVGIDGSGGGMGSYGEDVKFWTCKNCMVRVVSDTAYEQQQEAARWLQMTPEEREEEKRRRYPPKELSTFGCIASLLWTVILIGGLIFSAYVFFTVVLNP
jgi:hypothetical protein